MGKKVNKEGGYWLEIHIRYKFWTPENMRVDKKKSCAIPTPPETKK